MTESKSVALPLGYGPKIFTWWRGTDSNRRTLRERIYSPPRLATSLPLRKWWLGTESNRRHEDFQSSALPTELPSRKKIQKQMAELTGLEPATSGVTDRRELQLHHSSRWCRLKDLNPQPPDYKSGALPIELSRLNYIWWALTGSNRRPPACKAGALPAELSAHIW